MGPPGRATESAKSTRSTKSPATRIIAPRTPSASWTCHYGIYEVKPGDTLSKIAKHFLGDANRYQAIFELNTDQLKDPNMIRVGQKLKIPNR